MLFAVFEYETLMNVFINILYLNNDVRSGNDIVNIDSGNAEFMIAHLKEKIAILHADKNCIYLIPQWQVHALFLLMQCHPFRLSLFRDNDAVALIVL